MAKKPIQYVIKPRNIRFGKNGDKRYFVAVPTGRHRIDFRTFCERVARSTTFNRQEVEGILNYAAEIARDLVSNGDIVDIGDLGSLRPSFKSVAVPEGEVFDPRKHIRKPVVRLIPNRKYFALDGVTYEAVTLVTKEDKKADKGTEEKDEEKDKEKDPTPKPTPTPEAAGDLE